MKNILTTCLILIIFNLGHIVHAIPITTSSPEALAEFKKAQEVDQLWDVNPDALSGYNKAISLDPEFAQAYMFRARLLRRSDPEKKQADFDKAVQLSSKFPKAERLWITAFITSLGQDDEAAKQAFEKVNAVAGKDSLVQEWRRIFADYYWKDYTIAVDAAKKLTEIEPKSAQRWGELADMHALQKHFDKALKAAQQMLKLAPKEATSHDKVGEFFLSLGNLEQAEKTFNKVISLEPSLISPYQAIAAINIRRDKIKAAEQTIQTGIAKAGDEDKWVLYHDLAYLYIGLGENVKAYAAREKSESYPTTWGDSHVMIHERLTELAVLGKDWSMAIREAQFARKTPGIWPHHMFYSMAWEAIAQIQIGNMEQAEKLINTIKTAKNLNNNALQHALFYFTLAGKNYDQAQRHIDTVDNAYLKSIMLTSFINTLRQVKEDIRIQQLCKSFTSIYTRHILPAINQKRAGCKL